MADIEAQYEGASFLLRVHNAPGYGPAASGGNGVPMDAKHLRTSIEGVGASLAGLMEKLGPNELTVEFTVVAALTSGKLTALVVDGKVESGIKITMQWKKQ